MQAYILLKDAFGGEVRIPVNVSIPVPVSALNSGPKPESKPVPVPEPVKPGHGRWNKAYTAEFRQRATELGQLIGAGRAAKALGIPDSTIDNWIRKLSKRPTVVGVTAWSVT